MTAAVAEPPAAATAATPRLPAGAEPAEVAWTPESYNRAAEAGVFGDRRVELIRGRVIEMPAMGPERVSGRIRAEYRLRDHFAEADGFVVTGQIPLRLEDSEPEPDLVVYRGTLDDPPSDAENVLLVAEVSKSSLTFDRRTKLALYAEQGYRDYWILNLVDRVLEIYRDPARGADGGWHYGQKHVLRPGDHASPLARPDAKIAVSDLMPPASVKD